MRSKILILALTALALLSVPVASQAVAIVDDLGQTITLAQPARRIVPLYGAFMEMLHAMGADASVVARTEADVAPEAVAALPAVGTHMRPNVELILGLRPDLVIQTASRRETTPEMERLSAAGIPIAVFSPNSFEQLFSTMHRIGILTGREAEADAAVAQLKGRLKRVEEGLRAVGTHKRVLFEVRAEPLTAAGGGSITGEILRYAGAVNVVPGDKAMVQFGFETLLLANPDVYIVQQGPMNRNPMPPAARTHFDQLRAVREGHILTVDELNYSRPGPRCVDAVEELAAALYPDRFSARQ